MVSGNPGDGFSHRLAGGDQRRRLVQAPQVLLQVGLADGQHVEQRSIYSLAHLQHPPVQVTADGELGSGLAILETLGEFGDGDGGGLSRRVKLGSNIGCDGSAFGRRSGQPGTIERGHAAVGLDGHVTHWFSQFEVRQPIHRDQEIGNVPQDRGRRAQPFGQWRVVPLHVAAHADVAYLSLWVVVQRPHFLQVEQLASEEHVQQAATQAVQPSVVIRGGTVGLGQRGELTEGPVQFFDAASHATGGEIRQPAVVLVEADAAPGSWHEIPVLANCSFSEGINGLVHGV